MHKWHILCVEPNREHTASGHLLGRRYRPFVPQVPRRKHYISRSAKPKPRPVLGPMFPGYVFCLLDPEQDIAEMSVLPRVGGYQTGGIVHTRKVVISVASRVRSIPGVRDFLHLADGTFATLSETAITAISELQDRLGKQGTERPYPFTIGSHVRTTDSAGVWSGLQGVVQRLDKRDQVVLSVILPGKQIPLTLRAQWLEPVETAPRKGRHAGALA